MAASKDKSPDFFKDDSFDPMQVATGSAGPSGPGRSQDQDSERPSNSGATHTAVKNQRLGHAVHKKKAGFYISVELLNRFTRKFFELKLAGVAIENKSALLELALSFALDDLDKGTKSTVLKNLCN
jgi:hypothetical protein